MYASTASKSGRGPLYGTRVQHSPIAIKIANTSIFQALESFKSIVQDVRWRIRLPSSFLEGGCLRWHLPRLTPVAFGGRGKGKGKGPFIQRKPRFSFLPFTYSSFPHSGARIAPSLLSSSSSADHFVKCIGQPPQASFRSGNLHHPPLVCGKAREESNYNVYNSAGDGAGGARKGAQNELKRRSQTLFPRVKIRNVHLQWIFTTTVRYATVPYFLPPRFFLRVSTPPPLFLLSFPPSASQENLRT